MPSNLNELLLHPIRLRIVSALTGDNVTAKDLAKALPDVPQTTLYRHINVLVDGGLLEVVDEIPQRGTVERVFGFKTAPSLQPEDLRGLTKEEYQQTFTMVLTALLQDAINSLNNFADDEEIDLVGSGYHYSQAQLNLDQDEYEKLNNQIMGLMMEALKNKPAPGKKRRIFSYLFIPVVEPKD